MGRQAVQRRPSYGFAASAGGKRIS